MPKGSNLTCSSIVLMDIYEKSRLGLMRRGRRQAFGAVKMCFRSIPVHPCSEERLLLNLGLYEANCVLYFCKDSRGNFNHWI